MKTTLLLLLGLITVQVYAQDPTRFANQIEAIQSREFERSENLPLAVFTGSSSIRMWGDLESSFPGYQIVNNGFGGSEFTDLIYYKEELIFDFEPDYLFIYEGDNDINSGKTPSEVLAAAAILYTELIARLPKTQIFFISPKPSISRWNLKEDYEMVNQLIADFCEFDSQITFIDVWSPMLDENHKVREDLFIADKLHMNEAGYAIWKDVIADYLVKD